MKTLLNYLPIPISGLMLGLASLGNLLGQYNSLIRNFLGFIAFMILLLLIFKLILQPRCITEEFKNPVTASVMETLPMGIIILSTYILPLNSEIAFGVWLIGIGINLIIVLAFTKVYALQFDINKVFTSYFVLYVGMVVISLTAPQFDMLRFGQGVFWLGLALYLILIPIVFYRILKVGNIPEPARPTIIISAAPASLCLAGYLSVYPESSIEIVFFLGILASIMTIYALFQMPKMLSLNFYPSYSAFTFPFVISAIAFNDMTSYLGNIGYEIWILEPIRLFQIVWAIIIVLYVLAKYLQFLVDKVFNSEPFHKTT